MGVAVVALLTAAGGAGYAAGMIGSAQIKDNSIQSSDIKNKTIKTTDVSAKARKAFDGTAYKGTNAADLAIGPDFSTMSSVTLPKGTYVVLGNLTPQVDGTGGEVDCYLRSGASALDTSFAQVATGSFADLSLHATVTLAKATAIKLQCVEFVDPGSNVSANPNAGGPHLTALKVGRVVD